jgi:hypothetical protein
MEKIDIVEVKMAWYFQYEFDIYKAVKAGDYSHPEYFIFQFLK